MFSFADVHLWPYALHPNPVNIFNFVDSITSNSHPTEIHTHHLTVFVIIFFFNCLFFSRVFVDLHLPKIFSYSLMLCAHFRSFSLLFAVHFSLAHSRAHHWLHRHTHTHISAHVNEIKRGHRQFSSHSSPVAFILYKSSTAAQQVIKASYDRQTFISALVSFASNGSVFTVSQRYKQHPYFFCKFRVQVCAISTYIVCLCGFVGFSFCFQY